MIKRLSFFYLASALACADPAGRMQGRAPDGVAVYACGPELQALLNERGFPLSGSLLSSEIRQSRKLVPMKDGSFCLEGLSPGRYYVESPPLYCYGDNPAIDSIFAGGGCVYFKHRQSQLVEVVAGQTTQVDFP